MLNESFWDRFPKINQAIETIKQTAKIVAPEIHDPLKKGIDTVRGARAKIREAGKPMNERIHSWVLEQGKYVLGTPKYMKTYSDGNRHYHVNVAEKGVDRRNNDEIAGRMYKNPHAVVAYNPSDKAFKWINKPRSDSYARIRRNDGHIYYKYANQNADGVNEPIDTVQQNMR